MSQNKKTPMNNNRIKEVRLAQHKTQKDLAKLLGVSEQAIAYYEKAQREPSLKSWIKLADYLDVSTPYLQGISKNSRNEINKQHYTISDIISLTYSSIKLMYAFAGRNKYDVIPNIPRLRPKYGNPFNYTERACLFDTTDTLRKFSDTVKLGEFMNEIKNGILTKYSQKGSLEQIATRKDIDKIIIQFYEAVREKYLQCMDNKSFIDMVSDDLSYFVINQAKADVFGTTTSFSEGKRFINSEDLTKLPEGLSADVYQRVMDVLNQTKEKLNKLK